MSTRTLARGLAVGLVMTVMLTVVGVPAASAAPVGTASINAADRTVVAGTPEASFRFTVANTASSLPNPDLSFNPSINHVAIIPPQGRYTPSPDIVPPSGWTGRINPQGFFIFEHSGAGIAPGGNAVFTVKAAVGRPNVDLSRLWRVNLSSDRGVSNAPANEATPGALNTMIRVLQILNLRITGPSGVTDLSATAGQAATAAFDVFNAGGGTLAVTPSLTSSRGAADTISCSPTSASLGSLGTLPVSCTITFGPKGSSNLTADAAGTHPDGSADGVAQSLTMQVMSAVSLAYKATSLQPTEVAPNKPFTFRLSVTKSGDVSATLTKANTTLTFGPEGGPTFTATLAKPETLPAGGPTDVLLEFNQATVPAGMPADTTPSTGYRSYTPKLTVQGSDQNDFPVNVSPSITDSINVDALGPVLSLTSTPPKTTVAGAKDAATYGSTVNFSGDIKDRNTLCGGCPIVSSVVRQFDASQTPIAGADIPVTINNSGGNLSGSFTAKTRAECASGGTGCWNSKAAFMALEVIGADGGGNRTTALSNIVEVDLLEPLVVSALTGGQDGAARANDRTRIDVTLSELVASTATPPTDWTVDGHRVINAQPCAGETTAGYDCVQLTVDPPLGRNEETNVTYSPTAPTRANDRVGLALPNATVLAKDGILPALPSVIEIGGLPKQEGDTEGSMQYYTNQFSPDIKILVDPGDTVSAWSGSISGSPLCSATAEGQATQVTCTPSFAAQEATHTLLFRSVDARGNIGDVATEVLTIDITAPTLASAVRQGTDIVLTLSEKLGNVDGKNKGRNEAGDWGVFFRQGGEDDADQPRSVSGSGRTRTLVGSAASWNVAGANSHRAQYRFDGAVPTGRRYADRAGNDLADGVVAVSQ